MKALRVLPALALAGALTTPAFTTQARAEPTPEAAQALQAQLHDWLASLVQPAVTVAPDAITVVPEGDHFRLSLPAITALSARGVVPQGATVSLSARPLDAGRWAIDDLTLPATLRFTAPPMPVPPAKDGQPQKPPEPNVVTIAVDGLQTHGVIDPSFATTSSLDQSSTGVHVTSPHGSFTSGKISTNNTWQPDGTSRVNMLTQGSVADWKQTTILPDGQTSTVSINRVEIGSTGRKVSPAAYATIIRSIASLAPTLRQGSDHLTEEQRRLARAIVANIRDLADGMALTETLDGMTVQAGPVLATLRRFTFGEDFAAPEGKMSLGIQIALEGLDSPMIPPGVFHDYLPKKIVLKPRLSGVPVQGLVDLADDAIATDSKDMAPLQAEALALMAAGPLNLSLEEISFDLGPASLDGNISFDIASPTDITGDGDITITGLDALIKRANTTPELKQIAPALIFLKGIGKQDGNDTSFAINYENGSLKVNDTDLSSMIPAQKP
jgi:hypothetical protein